jgi:16S rRNA (adenine1518-N6/adenine1519-N6)-dimethyltransferase
MATRRPFRARRRFGQHFLAPVWAARVVAAIAPAPGDAFLEIGPGTGALTFPLAATGAPILTVELDRQLAHDLAQAAPPNVTILAGDILSADVIPLLSGLTPHQPAAVSSAAHESRSTRTPEPGRVSAPRFRVVGNLPYYITSPILFRLIDLHRRHGFFTDATLMVQKEVADRLVAPPSTRDYGVLTIHLSVHAKLTRLLDLPPGAFTPAPKVRSSVVRMEFCSPTVRIPDERQFDRVVKAMFSHRRKTVANALKGFDRSAPAVLAAAGIDGRRRPETLQVSEIARLAELFAAAKAPPVL